MADDMTFSVPVGDRERSNVFLSLGEAWENADGETVAPSLGVIVTEQGEDGKRHRKAKGGYATFRVDRIPGLIKALQAVQAHLDAAPEPEAE